MADNHSGHVDPMRRQFLIAARGAGALGAIAVLLGKGATVQTAPQRQAREEPAADGGYHETAHIREYYRAARYW